MPIAAAMPTKGKSPKGKNSEPKVRVNYLDKLIPAALTNPTGEITYAVEALNEDGRGDDGRLRHLEARGADVDRHKAVGALDDVSGHDRLDADRCRDSQVDRPAEYLVDRSHLPDVAA